MTLKRKILWLRILQACVVVSGLGMMWASLRIFQQTGHWQFQVIPVLIVVMTYFILTPINMWIRKNTGVKDKDVR